MPPVGGEPCAEVAHRIRIELVCNAEKQGALLFRADLLGFVRCFEVKGLANGSTVLNVCWTSSALGIATRCGKCTVIEAADGAVQNEARVLAICLDYV